MIFLFRHRLELLVTLACLGLLSYFALQATMGARSYDYRQALNVRYQTLSDQLAAVTKERLALETRVALMRPGNVDADLLDEMARRTLNMGRPNEFVVHLSN